MTNQPQPSPMPVRSTPTPPAKKTPTTPAIRPLKPSDYPVKASQVIVIDFEGYKDQPPVFAGVWEDGHFRVVILDERFKALVKLGHPFVKINAWDKVFPKYSPSGNTPMFDAIGMSIHKLKESLRILDLHKEQYQVKVFIVSDGEENASKEYRASQIGALIRGLIAEGWGFDYYGTDHDITSMADTLNIESHRRVMFQKSKAGMENARDHYMYARVQEKMDFMESRRRESSKKFDNDERKA